MSILKIFDRKLLKFFIVGTINTLIGSSIMFVLYNAFHFNYWVSSACNYGLTAIFSFFMNKYFTFKVKHWSVFMVAAFIMTIAFSYLIAYSIAKPLVKLLLSGGSKRFHENAALFTGMCLYSGINYFGQRLVVFRKKTQETQNIQET